MWSGWSTVPNQVCNETCGVGAIEKERFCNDPLPVHNTTGCGGAIADTREVKIETCFLVECEGNVFVIIKSGNKN